MDSLQTDNCSYTVWDLLRSSPISVALDWVFRTFYTFSNNDSCLVLSALFWLQKKPNKQKASTYYAVMRLYVRAGIQLFGWQQYPGTLTEQISAELSGIKAIQDRSGIMTKSIILEK